MDTRAWKKMWDYGRLYGASPSCIADTFFPQADKSAMFEFDFALAERRVLAAMTSSWTTYPKIWNLGHKQAQELLLDEVIVEEKVDGSQFSFGVFIENGEEVLRIRSKGASIEPLAPPKMFARAVATVLRLRERLVVGWTYRGEVLDNPRHNVLAYDRVPTGNIILFDVAAGYEDYVDRKTKEDVADILGLEVVPVLFRGRIESPLQIREFLERTSILGGQKIEGVVIKNYKRFGIDGKPLMGKFVSEAFKEVHQGEWRAQNPTSGDVVATLIAKLRTPARWAKAVQHLREAGQLTDSPKDIGLLIKEVQTDVFAEETDAIKDFLFKWAEQHVRRGIAAGLPEWYKERLMEQQFTREGGNDDEANGT